MSTRYTCEKCGKDVRVVDGKIERDCTCNAGVIAHMRATVTGQSRFAGEKAA